MLQSKNVKLVATRSGPLSTRRESLLVKWDSPFDRVVSSLDLEDGSGIGEKSSIYKVNLANCPLVQDQNERKAMEPARGSFR